MALVGIALFVGGWIYRRRLRVSPVPQPTMIDAQSFLNAAGMFHKLVYFACGVKVLIWFRAGEGFDYAAL